MGSGDGDDEDGVAAVCETLTIVVASKSECLALFDTRAQFKSLASLARARFHVYATRC